MKYERIREIYNSCDNSQMRDVDIKEIDSDDIDADVLQFCKGKDISCEKIVRNDGAIFDICIDGLNQRVTYVEISWTTGQRQFQSNTLTVFCQFYRIYP